MSMVYGMFDAVNIGTDEEPIYDRTVGSDFFAKFFSTVCQNGVTTDSFRVTASGGMNISVSPGMAVINGRCCYDESSTTLKVGAVSSVRNDLVVLRLDIANREISLAISPGASEPARGADIYELAIAKIVLPSAASEITADMIIDLRSNTAFCGLAGAAVMPHAHGNVNSSGAIGGDADRLVVTGEGGALQAITMAEARERMGFAGHRTYQITKSAAVSALAIIKANWENFAPGALTVHILGGNYGPSSTFFVSKVNDQHGAVLEIGYGVSSPVYTTLNYGTWSR
ncbi:MAG: hypothetical protein J6L81_08910 [Clostridia bacterium]|nr:hypothetical protein [Clostridia bacterium]